MQFLKYIVFYSLFLLSSVTSFAQQLDGRIIAEESKLPISEAVIQIKGSNTSAISSADGTFKLTIEKGEAVTLLIRHVAYVNKEISVKPPFTEALMISLEREQVVLSQVDVKGNSDDDLPQGNLQPLTPLSVNEVATPFNEFSQLVNTLPGVVSNNELSSSYAVRGGNFDENLIYVNGMEIYRPFLIRAGQQEGLSFINPDMVNNIKFSAGGWENKYGDKLSSNLIVDYKEPEETQGNINVGLLGASAYVGASLSDGSSLLLGARYKNARYLFNTFDTNGEYLPLFVDAQAFYSKKFNSKTSIDILASLAQNDYQVVPSTQETDFGNFQQKLRFLVVYDGAESLKYRTAQGGIRLKHLFSERFRSSVIVSAFQTSEFEYNNTEGFYRLCDVDRDINSDTFDQCISQRGAGSNFLYARNILDAGVFQIINRNDWQISKRHLLSFGVEYKYQTVDDLLDEYEFIDSADFVQINRVVNQENRLFVNFGNAYAQHEWEINNRTFLNYGFRVNYGSNTEELLFSPRVSLQKKLHPDKSGQLTFAAGVYRQYPFYRELRDQSGEINNDVNAQSSLHLVTNYTKNLELWYRPFQLTTAAYYKYYFSLIPYDVDNIRIRYRPELDAVGYATGADIRLSGEFIPDTQSWLSLSVLSAKEDVEGDGQGFIRRPSDQRVTATIFFQDYFINNPSLRVNLKLQVGSGLPFSAPNSLKGRNSFSGEWYRRMDVGFSKQFDLENLNSFKFIESCWIGVDVLNVLGVSNTISYSWIEDFNGQNFAIPNSLSARFLNVKGIVKF